MMLAELMFEREKSPKALRNKQSWMPAELMVERNNSKNTRKWLQAINICRSSGERSSREDVGSDSKQAIFAGLVAERNSGKDRQKWTVILNK